MARIVLITTLAVLLAAPLLAAQDAPTQEELLQRAQFLMSQERFEDAERYLRLAIEFTPEDRGLGAKAHLMLGEALARSGREADALRILDTAEKRYRVAEYQKAARALAARIRDHMERESDERKAREERLERITKDLEAQGLEGDELRLAYQKARDLYLKEAEYRRLAEMLKDAGVAEREIAERLERLEEDRRMLEEERRRLEERRAGFSEWPESPIDDPRDAALRERMEAEKAREDAWRERREHEVGAAREEFLRLAERLGIGPEETERFLEEHAPRAGPGGDDPRAGPGGDDPRVDDVIRRMEELERRARAVFEQIERKLEELDDRLTRIEQILEGK